MTPKRSHAPRRRLVRKGEAGSARLAERDSDLALKRISRLLAETNLKDDKEPSHEEHAEGKHNDDDGITNDNTKIIACDDDVLLGQHTNHPGNIRLNKLLAILMQKFPVDTISFPKFVELIIKDVRPGRFLVYGKDCCSFMTGLQTYNKVYTLKMQHERKQCQDDAGTKIQAKKPNKNNVLEGKSNEKHPGNVRFRLLLANLKRESPDLTTSELVDLIDISPGQFLCYRERSWRPMNKSQIHKLVESWEKSYGVGKLGPQGGVAKHSNDVAGSKSSESLAKQTLQPSLADNATVLGELGKQDDKTELGRHGKAKDATELGSLRKANDATELGGLGKAHNATELGGLDNAKQTRQRIWEPREDLEPVMEVKRYALLPEIISFIDGSGYHFDELGSLGIHSSSVLSQTVALKETLRRFGRIEPCTQLYLLSRRLLDIVADNSNPSDLRLEASKCIGHIGSGTFEELLSFDCTICHASDWLDLRDFKKDSLTTFMTDKLLKILVDHAKNPKLGSAQAASEACREIASTKQGKAHLDRINDKFMRFIFSERHPQQKENPSLLHPSSDFVAKTFALANRDNDMHQNSMVWCWSERLWEVGHGSHEDWIKRLVSSLIICCYDCDNLKHVVGGSNLFFRALARVSSVSPSIASYLFPMVILDLLLTDTVAATINLQIVKTVEESWVGNPQSLAAQKVSRAFGWLTGSLEKCSDADISRKGNTLLGFTVDLLRRISQKRFLGCNNFQAGLSEVPVSNYHKSPRMFGSVLELKPETSARLFMKSGKAASAIYYAETALSETGFVLATPRLLTSMQASLMSFLRDCTMTIQEPDAASAYALNMISNEFLESDVGFLEHLHTSAWDDNPGLPSVGKNTEDQRILGIANAVQGLGSKGNFRAYIDAVALQHPLYETARQSLTETWCKEKLTLMDWTNFPDVTALGSSAPKGAQQGFFEALSGAVVSLSNENTNALEAHVKMCRDQALSQCSRNYGFESPLSRALPHVEYFEILNDLEHIVSNGKSVPSTLLDRWDSELFEPDHYCSGRTSQTLGNLTLAFRETMVSNLSTPHTSNLDLERYLTKMQLQSLSISTARGELEFAEGCLQRLKQREFSKKTKNIMLRLRLRLEEANLMECRGYSTEAVDAAKIIFHTVDTEMREPQTTCVIEWAELKADSLLYCGTWTRKHQIESAKFVQENYLVPAARACHNLWKDRESPENRRRLSSSSLALAESAANLLENVLNRITSKEWKDNMSFLEEHREVVREIKDSTTKCLRDAKVHVRRWEEEKDMLEEGLRSYACLALKALGESLSLCDKSSNEHSTSHAFRIISIWLSTHLHVPDVNVVVDRVFETNLTCRFLPLTYQLFSRLGARRGLGSDPFHTTLAKLVVRMCEQHPYHCLSQLLTLFNGEDRQSVRESLNPKTRAANAIMDALYDGTDDANRRDLYNTYEAITNAYHRLAMAAPSEQHISQRREIPIKDFLKNNDFGAILRSAKCVPCVLTRPPTCVENHDYGNFMTDPPGTELIKKFKSKCCLASGLTRPKIVVCVGSTGALYKQLVKGNDNARQDAIMQQVFTFANDLLRRRTVRSCASPSSRKKRDTRCFRKALKLVTYNVVPLSPKSGILEWVDDTQPFLDYLANSRGAHSRYWEGEWSFKLCMEEMKKVSLGSHEEKRAAFDRVCKNFSPVFRHFFVEMFGHDLQAWHNAKTTYTRSCAVSSIVGHMLGIGDRHPNNILVHQKTGELVHIDFGIVFEQGHLRPTPETVPFRLTRDIVDGMGPLGTEGTFTAAAEETTLILRLNADKLQTILSGFVSEPLFAWGEGASRARARQEEEDPDPTDNLVTNHTLARIREKLQGYHDGTSSEQHSVEAQVQLLVNQATSNEKLCTMYFGWSAWL